MAAPEAQSPDTAKVARLETLRDRDFSVSLTAAALTDSTDADQQPLRVFEVSQVDLLSVDKIDCIAHTFHATLFLALVVRDGGLDGDLSQPEMCFPTDPATGKPTFRPSAKWFWDKIEFFNAVEISFKDVTPVRREGDDLVLRFRVSGVFVEVMELQEYPFDVQALTISIQLNCRTNGPMPVRFAGAFPCHGSRVQNTEPGNRAWSLEPYEA